MAAAKSPPESRTASMVLYCLVRKKAAENTAAKFLLITKQGHSTFPPTKIRPGEDLYHALVRPMEEDLGLPPGSYFPEEELPLLAKAAESPRYPGLFKSWYLSPVVISLTDQALKRLEKPAEGLRWASLTEILSVTQEPNVAAVAAYLQDQRPDLANSAPGRPSMSALASCWAANNSGGVRVVTGEAIRTILDAGSRAFNLRVADPYLPYQTQGLGFTWSFFTPRDTQDIHVHPLPCVEIYGVIEGRMQLWHKPLNQHGVRTWKCQTLNAGDWAEVEPLQCHFACWLTKRGLGTVIKAAATGELAGVGKLGTAGKTKCGKGSDHCKCLFPPSMLELVNEYSKEYEARDFARIAKLAEEAEKIYPGEVRVPWVG